MVETSFWGSYQRYKYVTPNLVSPEIDHFGFDCLKKEEMPKIGDEVYTICGTEMTSEWKNHTFILMAIGFFMILFTQIFSRSRGKRKRKKKSKKQ